MVKRISAWGKTNDEGKPSHHLAHHCMDVAAVLECLLEHPVLGARVAIAAGRPLRQSERTWLAALGYLHDIGKLSPGFQAKAWPVNERVVPCSHLDEGWKWIHAVMRRSNPFDGHAHLLFAPFKNATQGTDEAWLTALFAHHGRPVMPLHSGSFSKMPQHSDSFSKKLHYDWELEETAIGQAFGLWFVDASIDPELLGSSRLVHLFAGLLALADWIGSDINAFPHVQELDIEGYATRARAQAHDALRRIGLIDSAWPAAEPTFTTLTGFPFARDAQALIGKLSADTPLAILEAETGSGKTEAALWHFVRARSAGLVDALYFAVPTRAAASQLHRRVHEAMQRIGGAEAILAVPGQLRAGEAEGTRLPGFKVRWDDGDNSGSHWAAEHATRFLAAPIAVGTIDQVLMAGLKVKHAHLRGAALSRSLLVIDEVHASDAYMNRIARSLVHDHLALGGQALLMSATLGATERARWLGRPIPEVTEAISMPYPALWRSDSEQPLAAPTGNGVVQSKEVAPRLIETMDSYEAARLGLEAARQGARVLIIRNTVAVAIETWQAVIEAEPSLCLTVKGQPALHHSRFAAEDRRLLDRAIESTFGKDSTGRGLVAVGTQTLEQSLDIDADLLISDLCPMDVLLQRIGRLHRHQRPRPAGFEQAIVYVLCPQDGLDRLASDGARFENGLGAWQVRGVLQGIYSDLRVLETTRRQVANDTLWRIPRDNRRLVESATHPDECERVEHEMRWHDYSVRIDAKAIADTQHGKSLSLDRSAPFPQAFPDADESVQTRLGARGPLIELPAGTQGPFGLPITSIAPPARWCAGLVGDEPVSVETGDSNDGAESTLHIAMGDRRFTYDRSGLALEQDRKS